MKRALTLREQSIITNGGSGIIYIVFGFIQIFQKIELKMVYHLS